MSEELNTGVDETPIVETTETEKPPIQKNISDLLGEPTEDKPEIWEEKDDVTKHPEGFDPPDPDEPIVISPDKILKNPVSKSLISKGSSLASPIVVDVIDSFIPPMINIYAKADDYKRFCADDDAKKSMSDALAELMGSQDVELSPTWTFVLAVLAAYAPACIDAYELRKAHEKIAKQEKEIGFYKATIDEKEQENRRLAREVEKKELDGEKEIELLRKEIADIKATSAITELKAKQTLAKEVKFPERTPRKPKTTKKT